MRRYHGGPITPNSAAIACWSGANAMVSFYRPDQVSIAAEVAHSVVFDNGAFSAWTSGQPIKDWLPYAEWVTEWHKHPAFDWALIPDVIDGTEADNNDMIRWWMRHFGNRRVGERPSTISRCLSVPVWHLHESVERLSQLARCWPRVAIGSSGQFSKVGTREWWGRISEAMEVVCDKNGFPITKLHGLRQMNPTVFSHIPYASVDSTMVARNIGIDSKWKGTYLPPTKDVRAFVLRQRIETHASAKRWTGSAGIQENFELIG